MLLLLVAAAINNARARFYMITRSINSHYITLHYNELKSSASAMYLVRRCRLFRTATRLLYISFCRIHTTRLQHMPTITHMKAEY